MKKSEFIELPEAQRSRIIDFYKAYAKSNGQEAVIINEDIVLTKCPEAAEFDMLKKEAIEKFNLPELLELIKQDISQDHLEDDNLKMTAFLVGLSGLLKNPKHRMSMAFTGESAVGKDNVMKSILKRFPDYWMFLTGATQPAIEDEAVYCKIIALSEMNLFRDAGANKSLLEVVKQRTEGGTSALKKDAATGFKTTKHEQTEQGTVFYGTTDAERNAETETRFIFGHVEANEEKIRKVNLDTASKHSDLDKLISTSNEKFNWIKIGLLYLEQKYSDCEILIPFANLLITEKINGKNIIDCENSRSMRDFKRLLALTCACCYLHALQREVIYYDNKHKILIAEPEDLLSVVKYTREFFNQTYTGMDERLNQVLEVIENNGGNWTARDSIQRQIGTTINTIKSWMDTLEKMGLIEWKKGVDLNLQLGIKSYDGNKIYFKRYHKGIKKLLISCEISELNKLLKEQKVSVIDTFFKDLHRNPKVSILQESVLEHENKPNTAEIDTFSLTPFEDKEDPDFKQLDKELEDG